MLGSEVCSFGRFDSSTGQASEAPPVADSAGPLKEKPYKDATDPGLSGFSAQLEGLIVLKAGKTDSFLK